MRKGRKVWAGGVLALLFVMGGCGDDLPTGVIDVETAEHRVAAMDGQRAYRLYVPPSVADGGEGAEAAPLLLVFHGATQSTAGIELISWLYPAADAAGFIVAYPEASGDYWNTPNSPPAYWDVPDVPFAEAVIDDVASRHPVDRNRIFVTGYSNGAIFAQVLACLRGESVAALAVVGASISAEVARSCPWPRPMPTVVFFGDADPQFFWDDGLALSLGMLGGFGSASWLAENNGCAPEPVEVELGWDPAGGTETDLWQYRECDDGADVDFYRIRGGGHTWPGSPVNMAHSFGRKSHAVDASERMVAFFLDHPLGGGS